MFLPSTPTREAGAVGSGSPGGVRGFDKPKNAYPYAFVITLLSIGVFGGLNDMDSGQ